MNFAYGFAYMPDNFDPLDNPYVNFKVYKMTKGLVLEETSDYDIRRCGKEDLDRFVKETKQTWYNAGICFKDRDKAYIKANWFADDYEFPTIALLKCNPQERTCASEDEIESFLKNNPFFFVHQEMITQTQIWSHSQEIMNFPHLGNASGYYPAKAIMKSTGYGAVPYKPNDTFIPVDEVFFGINKFELGDNPWSFSEIERTETFLNINFFKTVQDTARAYRFG